MDWSAIFAGVAGLAAIIGLVYSAMQHRDTIRKDFLLWAIGQMDSPNQREGRRLIFWYGKKENETALTRFANSIENGKGINSKKYGTIRSAFALHNYISFFWKEKYIKGSDVLSVFPQFIEMWKNGEPIIQAIRKRPNQASSYLMFEDFAKYLDKRRARQKQ